MPVKDKNCTFRTLKNEQSIMKKVWLLGIAVLLAALPCAAQQIMYSNLRDLQEGRGDTVSILRVEKRSKNQILLMGGADYRIEAIENPGMSRYLRKRCYAVQVDSDLYVNCRKMRYKRYRFGNWYAPVLRVGDRYYFRAQPLGQVAASTATPADATKLGGEVGDAIAASALVSARVYYELDLQTGRAEFIGKDRMMELLDGYPELQEKLKAENSESAEVMEPYLRGMTSGILQKQVFEGVISDDVCQERLYRLEVRTFEHATDDGGFILTLTCPGKDGADDVVTTYQGRRRVLRNNINGRERVVWQMLCDDGKFLFNFFRENEQTLVLMGKNLEPISPKANYSLKLQK